MNIAKNLKMQSSGKSDYERDVRDVRDGDFGINILFTVTVEATGVARVTHNLEEGPTILPMSQCHCHFTDLLMSLSIGDFGRIEESLRLKKSPP